MTNAHDVLALRRKRAEAARKADQMMTLFDAYPRGDIKVEMERAVRLVDSYDRLLSSLST